MAVIDSQDILRKNAYEVLKHSREAGESVILTRDGKPEIIMLTFDKYVELRMAASDDASAEEVESLEQMAVDSTVCMRNCPFRSPRPGSIVRKK